MLTSESIASKLVMKHQVNDYFRRTIDLLTNNLPIDLTACIITFVISKNQYDNDFTLTVGNGLIASNLAGGQFKIDWISKGKLIPNQMYWYRLEIIFSDGAPRTFLQDKFLAL